MKNNHIRKGRKAPSFLKGVCETPFITFLINKIRVNNAEKKIKSLSEKAQKEAEKVKRDMLFEAKEETHKLKMEFEKEMKEKKSEMRESENRLIQREQNMDKRDENYQKREQFLDEREEKLQEKITKIQNLIQIFNQSPFIITERIKTSSKHQTCKNITANTSKRTSFNKIKNIFKRNISTLYYL